MALSFIKRVFTFGDLPDEKPKEGVHPADATPVAADTSVDPVSSAEVETARAPVDDGAAADAAAVLAGAEETSELGVVPLSLLEAEATAAKDEAVDAAIPPSVPSGHLPHKAGDRMEGEVADQAESVAEFSDTSPEAIPAKTSDIAAEKVATKGGIAVQPISPPVEEVSGRTEAGIPSAPTSHPGETPAPAAPVLPKGFSTARVEETTVAIVPPPKLNWFQRLRAGLARTSSQLTGQIAALFTKRKLDDETLEDLEDLLIQADLGVETAMRITGALSSERYGKDVTGEDVSRIMSAEITKVLTPVAKPLQLDLNHKPHVILVVGVNGTGKTTTIGKLAAKLSGAGLKVMLAAGDTFRAAAIEQLKIWADRTGSEFIGTKLGADAAGLAYDAFEQARANQSDVLIIDTAGRLQNKAELMAELEKIVRVLGKLDPDAPHTVLQTLDATTGQNAMNQVEIFRNVAGVGGLIMTKLDGTARGGILVAIAAKHKLPVYFIGVGEGVDDLEPFEAQDFAHAIAGLPH